MEAQYAKSGKPKPYYLAHTSINVLTITEPLPGYKSMNNGSSELRWWAPEGKNSNLSRFALQKNIHLIPNLYGII